MRWLLILTSLALVACSSAEPRPEPARAFYYWRTTMQLSAAEQAALASTQRLYLRVFDIDADGEVLGRFIGTPPPIDTVPVVFLRSDVFLEPRPGLAKTVVDGMLAVAPHARELQLDCDWTEHTRDAYFAFLREVRALAKRPLSATIRLHQVKYRERTGVPPVERGMLMFYNMGRFSPDPDQRAIFDEASARKYLDRIGDYPLPLDAALPIWSWLVHVRDDRVIGLLQSTDPDELPALDFVRDGLVTRSAFLHGTILRGGDRLKVEVMTPADTLAAARMLGPHLSAIARTVALFDLSERNLVRHAGQLDEEFRALR